MQQSAEVVNPFNYLATAEPMKSRLGDGLLEVDAAVGAFLVVGDELPQYPLGVALAADKGQVRRSDRAVSTNLSAKAFALGARKGVLIIRAPTDVTIRQRAPCSAGRPCGSISAAWRQPTGLLSPRRGPCGRGQPQASWPASLSNRRAVLRRLPRSEATASTWSVSAYQRLVDQQTLRVGYSPWWSGTIRTARSRYSAGCAGPFCLT